MSAAGPTIRRATVSDAALLAELRYEFRAAIAVAVEPREAFLARCSPWMARQLGDDGSGWLCWLACDGNTIVGNLWLARLAKIPNPVGEPEAHAYVTNFYVRPGFRGGTGARLLEAALAWCRAEGVDSVILWPTRASRSLYARHGFEPGDDLMELSLGATDQPSR